MKYLIQFAVIALRILYWPFKLFLKPRNKVTMISRQSNTPPLSFVLTKNALKELDNSLEVVIISKKVEGNILHKIQFCLTTIVQMFHIATSKITIVDGFCIPVSVLKHKENQLFVQMWHALNAIKKFGYMAIDKPAGVKSELAEIMCMHKNYTHILSGSKITGEIFQKSFNSDGEIVILGLPYLDHIQNKNDEIIKLMEEKYPQIKNKKNILYAPTFRKHHIVNLDWIEKAIDLDEVNVIVKLHPVDRKGFDGNCDPRIICDDSFLSYEWLWCCESVITDYSGISLESALLNRKLYFYLYDRDTYENETGLNVNLYDEPLSKYVVENVDDLRKVLKEEYDFSLLKEMKDKYIEFDPKDCSKQFANWIIKKLGE